MLRCVVLCVCNFFIGRIGVRFDLPLLSLVYRLFCLLVIGLHLYLVSVVSCVNCSVCLIV